MAAWEKRVLGRLRSCVCRPLAALVLLAAAFIALPGQAQAATKIQGIDVTVYQGTVDWEAVADDGIQFVVLGTGWYRNGSQTYDSKFTTNIEGAISAGIPVGVYRYTYSTTVAEMREEAYQVLDLIDGYKISYPVALDMEASCYNSMTKAQRTELANAFLEVIEEAGYYPMLYANNYWFTSLLDRTALSDYDFWVARYGNAPSISPVSMWQYSSTGKVDGIRTAVDLDYSYKDYTAIITPRTYPLIKRTSESGWQTDGTNYWYLNSSGKILKKTWLTLSGKKYYLASNGYRVTGWAKISSKYYYFNSSGEMQTGWITLNGKTYYLDPSTGARVTGWKTISGSTYRFNSSGVMQTGWVTISKKCYYLDPTTGARVTGWLTIDENTYYLKKNSSPAGQRCTGWVKIDGNYYYFNSSGVMQKGWARINKKYYYLDPTTGARVTGWLTIDG
ncbi:MAG: cell wall-binding protein, partial [Clostridiales bacterium]|nr:cell wall-binding protein [Clostridiales bacterium]